jgi:hypothetical protein
MIAMSQNTPESDPRYIDLTEVKEGEVFHGSGSAEVIGLEPGENFVAPNMTLDSYDIDAD